MMLETHKFRGSSMTNLAGRALVISLVTVCLASAGSTQTMRSAFPVAPIVTLAEGEVASADTVSLLVGLSAIERDMMLGMLFLQDGLTSTVGSHFTHPRQETWPNIKDGLAAAGIADFEPLLVTLETETDKAAVTAAYLAVNEAVLGAQAVLKASDTDKIAAIVTGVEAAYARFNPAGPTDVVDYQDGWAGLMIERGKLDLLMQSGDPALAKSATDMALAMDDVILMMPDPAITAPVEFDPAPVAALLEQIKAMGGAI